MKKRLITVVIGVLAVIALISLVYLWLSSSGDPGYRVIEPDEENGDESETEQESNESDASSDTNVAGVQEEARTEAGSQYQTCVREQKTKFDDRDEYVAGSLLVSFKSGLSFATATRVISSERLSLADRDQEETFEQYGWLEVSVPEGEEAEWYCTLRERTAVRSVSLNQTFQLHE